MRFERLTVLLEVERKQHQQYSCLCDCGNTLVVDKYHLLSGHTRSCGCLQREVTSTHGMTRTPIYRRWVAIQSRCYNPKNTYYHNYGGRGIVCEWKTFEDFYADMGDIPSLTHSVERIDNNGNYSKGNCKWATKKEQANNTRQNHFLEHDEKRLTIQQWADRLHITPNSIHGRLRRGWSIKNTLTRKPRERGFNKHS